MHDKEIFASKEDGARRSPSTLRHPGRLYHEVPSWVKAGSVFHVRIRCSRESQRPLTEAALAGALLESAKFYHDRGRWWSRLFLLMPDHLHALLAFPNSERMSGVVGDWKRFQEKQHGIVWQEGFFDHRIRSEQELQLKAGYIRKNPVVKHLCVWEEERPHVLPSKVDGDLRAPLVGES